jgi:hypothetical protein
LASYQAAINDRRAGETAAANGPGINFWAERLAAAGKFHTGNAHTNQAVPIADLPSFPISRSIRGSLFPYVLFSIHRTLRDVAESGPTVIGYPWGGRNVAHSDIVGCFMNTAISLDPTGPRQPPESTDEFRARWYHEIDYADVPFTAVTALGSTFPGTVSAYLSYTQSAHAMVQVAGVSAVHVPSTHSRIPPTCTFMAAVRVCDNALQLRLVIDEQITGFGNEEFGARWWRWLETATSSIPEQNH